jgi:hypothetical protein
VTLRYNHSRSNWLPLLAGRRGFSIKEMKMGNMLRLGLILLGVLNSVSLWGADYYVSPRGSDSNPGSQAAPWKSLVKVSQTAFKPGDRILLEGGSSFQGTLLLDNRTSGTSQKRITVASYGNGRATIQAGKGSAIVLDSSDYVTISHLNCAGAGRKTGNSSSGVQVRNAKGAELTRLEVQGFQHSGVALSGVQDARVTHVHARSNGFAGISCIGGMSRDLYIGYCLAENNPGDPTILDNHSGNGIVVGERIQNARIEYCEARYNGWDMPRTGNGPVGIWAYQADNVVIQYCVSHHNRSTGTDGGGFDFDGGVTNSILQYNYSHDNHGAGYLLCQYGGASLFKKNIVRYNISQDDGLSNHNAGIYVWVGGVGMEDSEIYNNTIFNSKGAAVAFGVPSNYKGELPRMTFRNNIFVAGEAQIEGGSAKGRFEGNIYWAMGDGGFLVDGYTDLAAWVAATGQEKIDDTVVGRYVDPLLRKDEPGLLTDPMKLKTLAAYNLLAGSPAIDTGLDLRKQFNLDPGKKDFYGNSLPQGKNLDVGAHEFPSLKNKGKIEKSQK